MTYRDLLFSKLYSYFVLSFLFIFTKRITANFEDFIKKIEFLKIHNRKYFGFNLKKTVKEYEIIKKNINSIFR